MDKKIIIAIIVFAVIAWFFVNPVGKFGLHFFGFTVYNGVPFPYSDLKIHSNGFAEIREKSHFVSSEEASDLMNEEPDFLIIGIGYDEMVKVDEKILDSGLNVLVLETSKAIEKFNELKNENKQAGAIIHLTC